MGKQQLNDTIIGGVYEYYLKLKNGTEIIFYRGSSQKTLKELDNMHRKGEHFPIFQQARFNYSMTDFRRVLRTVLGQQFDHRWIYEPKSMTYQELLALEGESIRERKKVYECMLNKDINPLKTEQQKGIWYKR